ncbi:MAG: FtsW/RodA/SpoVE family cell cycle protein [Omnitrophica WOR_2 bacterium]
MKKTREETSARVAEAFLLALVFLTAVLGFTLLSVSSRLQEGSNPWAGMPGVLLPAAIIGLTGAGLHVLMRVRQMDKEQLILPVVCLLFTVGALMIERLQGPSGLWQQFLRGYIPGVIVIGLLILRPHWVEQLRRWIIPLCVAGLLLPIATAFFGVIDETGARLALKVGLVAVQPSEIIKLILILFLAWYIDREGQKAEGRAQPFLGWLRLPSLSYFLPGALVVSLATLALVKMSDYGAVLILACLFIAMLFAGFETRIFLTVGGIGLGLALAVALVLRYTWHVPTVIQYRFLAFLDPWSNAQVLLNGKPAGITISEGPGYQIQQAIYAMVSGGLSGTGLGFGTPQYVPLAHSDFIFAAIIEELGSVTGLALLGFYVILILRIARVALLIPAEQVFERLLLIGIAIHFFVQVFVMVGGTLNLLPLTGVTIPFLSLGGMALLVNLTEIGLVLSIAQRLEAEPV